MKKEIAMSVLNSNDIMNKIKYLDNWSFYNNQIQSNYQFKVFKEAL
jgi:pterin-4a-carbinolamine dehydratase